MLKAYETHTRAMAISVNGKMKQESYFKLAPDPIDAGAGYRLLLSAAYGKLLEDSIIKNLDLTVASLLPSWNQSIKKQVTLSHLLNGSSGMLFDVDDPDERNPVDAYRFAEAAIIVSMPGLAFQPNEKELWLLSALLREISGISPEQYFSDSLLKPMEIKDYVFRRDVIGNITGIEVVAGQWIHLAEVFLSGGRYKEKQFFSSKFCRRLFTVQPETEQSELGAELWYDSTYAVIDDEFIAQISSAGMSAEVIAAFQKMKGRYPGLRVPSVVWEKAFGADYEQVLQQQVLPIWPVPFKLYRKGKCRGALIAGSRGEQIYIDQKAGICAVRIFKPKEEKASLKDQWPDFPVHVLKYP